MTIYNTLLAASGLSQREAAAYLDVNYNRVRDWTIGRYNPPAGVVDELLELVRRQSQAAQAGAAQIKSIVAERGQPEEIEIGVAVDDHEAQSIGWPTASAHRVVVGLTIAELPPEIAERVVVVPRASTIGTAAAEIL